MCSLFSKTLIVYINTTNPKAHVHRVHLRRSITGSSLGDCGCKYITCIGYIMGIIKTYIK